MYPLPMPVSKIKDPLEIVSEHVSGSERADSPQIHGWNSPDHPGPN